MLIEMQRRERFDLYQYDLPLVCDPLRSSTCRTALAESDRQFFQRQEIQTAEVRRIWQRPGQLDIVEPVEYQIERGRDLLARQ